MRYEPFEMERWQSVWENRVPHNLSESGVHPLTTRELLDLAGDVEVGGTRRGGTGGGGTEGGATEAALLRDLRLGYGQTNGSERLRARIAALYPGTGPESVLVTSGGAEANFVATWRLFAPGRPVAAVLPTYMQVPRLVESLGGRVLPVPSRREAGWQPDLDRLDAALAEGAAFLLITNPNNPTGATLPARTMDAVCALAERHGAWILADEVYRGAERGAEPDVEETPSFLGRSPRVLVTGSLSKAYGLPGLRIGWVAGPRDAVADLWARTDFTTIAVSSLSDGLARIALRPDVRRRLLRRTRGFVRENYEIVREWAESRPGRITLHPPDAGAICWMAVEGVTEAGPLAERLRSETGVLVVPGDQFGRDGFLRLGFGVPREQLLAALDRMGALDIF